MTTEAAVPNRTLRTLAGMVCHADPFNCLVEAELDGRRVIIANSLFAVTIADAGPVCVARPMRFLDASRSKGLPLNGATHTAELVVEPSNLDRAEGFLEALRGYAAEPILRATRFRTDLFLGAAKAIEEVGRVAFDDHGQRVNAYIDVGLPSDRNQPIAFLLDGARDGGPPVTVYICPSACAEDADLEDTPATGDGTTEGTRIAQIKLLRRDLATCRAQLQAAGKKIDRSIGEEVAAKSFYTLRDERDALQNFRHEIESIRDGCAQGALPDESTISDPLAKNIRELAEALLTEDDGT